MTFGRDPKNITPVVDGEVLVSFADDPKISATGEFDSSWLTLGILNDGSRVALNRVIEKNKASGWGFGVVAVETKPGELTMSAETLEDNEAVRRIAWPKRFQGEGKVIDGAEILYHSEDVAMPYVASVETMQNGKKRIRATRERAIVTMEDIGFGQEVTGREVSIDVQVGANKDAFDELFIEDSGKVVENKDQIKRFVEQLEKVGSLHVKIVLPSSVSGGTWSITPNGKSAIQNLEHNISASQLKAKLSEVDGVSNVSVTGTAAKGFIVKLTGVDSLTANGASLTGGDSTTIKVEPQ